LHPQVASGSTQAQNSTPLARIGAHVIPPVHPPSQVGNDAWPHAIVPFGTQMQVASGIGAVDPQCSPDGQTPLQDG
jgi:hypothetical protein